MESAKAKVSEFLHKNGKHDTTVHETVAPSVTHETVKPHQHENVTTAVDREVHQDHHHTSVQPIHDKKVLPEQHHYNEVPTQSTEFHHGDDEAVSRALRTDAAKFKNETVKTSATASQTHQPTVSGEHVHHHIHETIQPVVHKETVEPHVVHTVAKVHEKHHNPAQVHETSALPAMSMSDFKSRGGHLTGREERTDHFEGAPRNANGIDAERGGTVVGAVDTDRHAAPTSTTDPLLSKTTSNKRDSAMESPTHEKPSIKDKLNPKVDADGDGKAGILS